MKHSHHDELELQKNRLEILKMSGRVDMIHTPEVDDDALYAWEYELDYYKKLKKREIFYKIGSLAGILALVIELIVHGPVLMGVWFK